MPRSGSAAEETAMPKASRLLLPLVLLLAACGGSDGDASPHDGDGGGGDTLIGDHVPAPRGPTRPATLPAALVDCAAGDGTLAGRFLAPNGETPVAGAFVYIASGDCWAGTDQAGRFSAKGVPAGETTVRAEKGLFRAEANGAPGTALRLRLQADAARIAYVAGSFDAVQFLLDSLGFAPEQITEDDLPTARLADFDAIFLNCGMAEYHAFDDDALDALRAWVEGGGVLYTSDWAEIYVKQAFPGRVHFRDPDPRAGKDGEREATVHDEGFLRALGRSDALIEFDSAMWAVIDSVPESTRVLVRGPVELFDGTDYGDRPYMVQFDVGEGRVTYTSFHYEAMPSPDMLTILEQLIFRL